jgi:hypothetical protein
MVWIAGVSIDEDDAVYAVGVGDRSGVPVIPDAMCGSLSLGDGS